MKLAFKTRGGVLLQRLTRFSALVRLEEREETVYLPNSGRLRELLTPGRGVMLAERPAPHRKTGYDLLLVKLERIWVSVDARIPGDIVYEALSQGALPQFLDYPSVRREVYFGEARLDFMVSNDSRWCYLETKSVTLVRKGRALFPDAPTARGRRHLETLIQAKEEGHEGAVLFLIQREDAKDFSPNDETDPDFGQGLRKAAGKGIKAYAYRCRVTPGEIRLAGEVPVVL